MGGGKGGTGRGRERREEEKKIQVDLQQTWWVKNVQEKAPDFFSPGLENVLLLLLLLHLLHLLPRAQERKEKVLEKTPDF